MVRNKVDRKLIIIPIQLIVKNIMPPKKQIPKPINLCFLVSFIPHVIFSMSFPARIPPAADVAKSVIAIDNYALICIGVARE